MFTNKAENGKNNICGETVAALRVKANWSQRQLADKLLTVGLDVDKNAIQRIEAGLRFVTDIELVKIAEVFDIDVNVLLN